MENSDFSDSSDEDYIPNEGEAASEEEDSGEEEDFVGDEDNEHVSDVKKENVCLKSSTDSKRPKPRKKKAVCRRSKRNLSATGGDFTGVAGASNSVEIIDEVKEQEEKQKGDALWADFMKDVGVLSKPKPNSSVIATETTSTSKGTSTPSSTSVSACTNTSNKVTVQQEYDFAGETIIVTKEVDANSKEAKQANSSNTIKVNSQRTTATSSSSSSPSGSSVTTSVAPILKRPAGGLNAVLGKLNKKPKMSTLQKSKLDWDGFKEKEGIDDELKTHNRGKQGYLERVAFLERSDQRQFEIERNLRLGSRKQ